MCTTYEELLADIMQKGANLKPGQTIALDGIVAVATANTSVPYTEDEQQAEEEGY